MNIIAKFFVLIIVFNFFSKNLYAQTPHYIDFQKILNQSIAGKKAQDDLKKISGVGPVMEQKLHQLGIFTFEQVSKMTKREYDLLDSITGSFPGRAERDDWAGQAKKLINN